MIKRFLHIINLVLVLTFAFRVSLYAQSTTIKAFSKDSVLFFEEMTTFLTDVKKKEGKKFMEEFEIVWYGGVLSENQRNTIYRTCNFMLDKKLHPYPEFHSYLFSLMSFVESGQSYESFSAWQKSINQLMDGKNKRKFTEYLKFSNGLFEQNALYVSASTVWRSNNTNYKFEMENGVPKIIFPSLDLKCFAKGDSAIIYNTKGYYYPTLNLWYGDKGMVNWIRAGFSSDSVYAEIPHKYELNLKSEPGMLK